MQQLDELNTQLIALLEELIHIPAENEETDELVLNLQDVVGQRQIILDTLLADTTMTDTDYLQQQFKLTQEFTAKATIVMAQRQALLHAGSQNKRQINVYKTIDSNR